MSNLNSSLASRVSGLDERGEALKKAIGASPVVLLAAGPGEGAVTASREILGPGSREIELAMVAAGGVEAVKSAFKEAASRSERVVVSGFQGVSEEVIKASVEGVKALAAAGGKAVVVLNQDLSGHDFGPAIFMPWSPKPDSMDISSALRARREAGAPVSAPAAKPSQA